MKENIVIIIGILATLVEITPIKINPISWLGEILNKRLSNKIDEMQKNIYTLSEKQDYMEIDMIRHRILAIDTLIRKGEKLKRYQFESVFKDIDKWQWYHNKYKELNGMIDMAIENIKEAFKNEKFDI